MILSRLVTIAAGAGLLAGWGHAQTPPPRARALGIPLEGTPGPLNAITDVAGVAVGHTTLIRGTGRLRVGTGPVRTGVTAVFPRGRGNLSPVFAGWFNLNGNGEMTGTEWIDDYGLLLYPITITNTNSVGTVRDAVIEWAVPESPGSSTAACRPSPRLGMETSVTSMVSTYTSSTYLPRWSRRGPVPCRRAM